MGSYLYIRVMFISMIRCHSTTHVTIVSLATLDWQCHQAHFKQPHPKYGCSHMPRMLYAYGTQTPLPWCTWTEIEDLLVMMSSSMMCNKAFVPCAINCACWIGMIYCDHRSMTPGTQISTMTLKDLQGIRSTTIKDMKRSWYLHGIK